MTLNGSIRPREDISLAAQLLYQELAPFPWFTGIVTGENVLIVEVKRVEQAREVPRDFFGWRIEVRRNQAIVS